MSMRSSIQVVVATARGLCVGALVGLSLASTVHAVDVKRPVAPAPPPSAPALLQVPRVASPVAPSAAAFAPVVVNTSPMSISGGAIADAQAAPFSPVVVTTAAMSISGGALPATAAFTPVVLTTAPFTISGN